ncbi:MAG: HAD-IIB family hydrolase [Candidatus Sericytochromatia bacterium]|nr:HAD-IIB family hydrolase [Candidatus Sericytochromatia bacterium]
MHRCLQPKRLLAFDLDGTLVGHVASGAAVYDRLTARSPETILAYITGRTFQSAEELLLQEKLPQPDILATGLGTEIRWGRSATLDRAWRRRVGRHFSTQRVRKILSEFTGLKLQPEEALHPYKLSFFVVDEAPDVYSKHVEMRLLQKGVRAKTVYSSGRDLDIIPISAGKGAALRWMAKRLQLSPQATFACGDSCNDLEMLLAAGMASVVGNAEPSLLRQLPNWVYRAQGASANGAKEGLDYWFGDQLNW